MEHVNDARLESCHLDFRNRDADVKRPRTSPFVGHLISQWDARYVSDGAAPPSSCVSDLLTVRERDVLAMISQGLSNKRVARALEISPETVKSHVKHIFLKLGVSTRTEAVFRALSLEVR
jgi:LuxR family transcriptional regulator, maltose regulon positive regulatory protein